jgi:methionyl-tRNA synthetase
VGIFGNFINRVAVLIHKYYGGVVPAGNSNAEELIEIKRSAAEIAQYLENFEFRNSLTALMNLARFGNQYLQIEEPWKTIKDNPEKAAHSLFIGAQIAVALAQLSEPFMPFSSEKLLKMFTVEKMKWEDIETKNILIETGHQINEASLLFSKIEDETIEFQIWKLENTKQSNKKTNPNANPMKDEIQFDDFSKIDLRTATILTAEKVEKADKLLKFTVDTGVDVRTVVSGVAESFSPEELIGKQVMILLNLAPRKIRGIESQGMFLLTTKPDGKLSFVTPDETVENGIEIG